MSINDVLLFGTLAEDVVPRKSRTGQVYATFRVKTYKQVLDRLSGQTKEHTDLHEVQVTDHDALARLEIHGKAGAWVRIRGEIAYKENRSMFVRVPVLGGMAVVSAYFGTDITPSHPHKSAVVSEGDEQQRFDVSTTDASARDAQPNLTDATALPEASRGDSGIEAMQAAALEVESNDAAGGATTALDELHADAGLAVETKVDEPPPSATRPPVPGMRRPVAAPVPTSSPASSSAAASRPAPPRPSAPSLPRAPAGLPSRPPGGMPRPPVSAPTPGGAPARSSFNRPAAPSQSARPVAPPVKSGNVLTADDIPF